MAVESSVMFPNLNKNEPSPKNPNDLDVVNQNFLGKETNGNCHKSKTDKHHDQVETYEDKVGNGRNEVHTDLRIDENCVKGGTYEDHIGEMPDSDHVNGGLYKNYSQEEITEEQGKGVLSNADIKRRSDMSQHRGNKNENCVEGVTDKNHSEEGTDEIVQKVTGAEQVKEVCRDDVVFGSYVPYNLTEEHVSIFLKFTSFKYVFNFIIAFFLNILFTISYVTLCLFKETDPEQQSIY